MGYEVPILYLSSDVFSSDLRRSAANRKASGPAARFCSTSARPSDAGGGAALREAAPLLSSSPAQIAAAQVGKAFRAHQFHAAFHLGAQQRDRAVDAGLARGGERVEKERSEEHTSELQSLMRISYAVFCLNI